MLIETFQIVLDDVGKPPIPICSQKRTLKKPYLRTVCLFVLRQGLTVQFRLTFILLSPFASRAVMTGLYVWVAWLLVCVNSLLTAC